MGEQWLCKKGYKAHKVANIPGNGENGVYYAACNLSKPLHGFTVSDSPDMFGCEPCKLCCSPLVDKFAELYVCDDGDEDDYEDYDDEDDYDDDDELELREFSTAELVQAEKELAPLSYWGGYDYSDYCCVNANYISDLHLTQHMELYSSVDEMLADVIGQLCYSKYRSRFGFDTHNRVFIFAGDIADDAELVVLFFKRFMDTLDWLDNNHCIFVLGNHDYIGFDSVDEAVLYYKEQLGPLGVTVLHNEAVVFHNHGFNYERVRPEFDKLFVIYGGTGFAKYNSNYNANNLVCCNGFNRDVEIEETDRFEAGYAEALAEARKLKALLICVSHYEYRACLSRTDEDVTYVHGHTHDEHCIFEERLVVWANRQVGYKSGDFSFGYMFVGLYPNPYGSLPDGCYPTTVDDYRAFCQYSKGFRFNIRFAGLEKRCKTDMLYVVKSHGYYGFFLLSTLRSGCKAIYILNGGALRRVYDAETIEQVVGLFDEMVQIYLRGFGQLFSLQKDISEALIRLGFYGKIHGLIVDIDFENHVAVNPFDGSLTWYYSPWFCAVKTFSSFAALCEHNSWQLPSEFLPAVLHFEPTDDEVELQEVSRSGGFYGVSRKMAPLTRLFESHVLQRFDISLLHDALDNSALPSLGLGDGSFSSATEDE